MRHVGNRVLFPDDATTLLAYTTADVYTFVDIPGRDLLRPEIENLRLGFRVRNLTNVIYAQWADTTYPDQVLLPAHRAPTRLRRRQGGEHTCSMSKKFKVLAFQLSMVSLVYRLHVAIAGDGGGLVRRAQLRPRCARSPGRSRY